MQCADGQIDECPGSRRKVLPVDGDADFALENIEALLFPAMHVWRRAASRRHDGFPKGVLAIGLFAGRQQPLDIAHDTDCASFTNLPDGWLVRHLGTVLLVAALC